MRPVLQNGCQVAALCRFELFLPSISVFDYFRAHTPAEFSTSPFPRPSSHPRWRRSLPRPHHPCIAVAVDASTATTPALALAALSPRPHRPRLASPRRASERAARPSKEFWSPESAASVASSSTRSATAPGGQAAEEFWCLYGHLKRACGSVGARERRATGDGRGERRCGTLRGNCLSEARSRMTRGSDRKAETVRNGHTPAPWHFAAPV